MRQVIYAWNYLEWGGAQVHILAIAREARNFFDVSVVVPRGTDQQFLKYLKDLEIEVREFDGHAIVQPVAGIRKRIDRRLQKIKSEYAMLKAIGSFDLSQAVVHVDLLPHSSLGALLWLSTRSRVFITSHNAMPPSSSWREKLWRIKAKVISRFPNFNVFCSNQHARDYFRQQYSDAVGERMKVTYTSVDPEEIDKALAVPGVRGLLREKFQISESEFVVLGVGNFIDRKGRWTYLDAARRIASDPNLSKIKFLWLTPSLPSEADMRRVEAYGLGDRFRLVSSSEVGTERQDILQFFRIADAFALPSFVEGLPIALLEAMALGLPSISTNVFAIPEALINDETGILIEAGDDAALADGVIRYFRDPKLREQLAKKGSDHVRKRFVDREVAKVAIAEYHRVFEELR